MHLFLPDLEIICDLKAERLGGWGVEESLFLIEAAEHYCDRTKNNKVTSSSNLSLINTSLRSSAQRGSSSVPLGLAHCSYG